MTSVLELLESLDWVSPAKAMFEMLGHGPGHTFYIGLDSGVTDVWCEFILRRRGIEVYGRCIAEGDAFFTVSKDQAERAERILLQAGIPLKYHLFSERNQRYLRR